VTAEAEGTVSNGRLQQISTEHPFEISQMLQRLVAKGFLRQFGKKRGSTYQIATADNEGSTHLGASSTHLTVDHAGSKQAAESAVGSGDEELCAEITALLAAGGVELQELLSHSKRSGRMASDDMRRLISGLCRQRFLTPRQLASLLNRRAVSLQQHYVRGMVESGERVMRFANEPNHPQQAYMSC